MNTNYNIWKENILDLLDSSGINYGMIGDMITCIDNYGNKTGDVDLRVAWKYNMGYFWIMDNLKYGVC